MVVGFQGIRGSNSELAAIELLKRAGIEDYQLEPCLSSREVVAKLFDRRVDLGALAIRNNAAGEVEESSRALRGYQFDEVARCSLPVIHCLFAKSSTVRPSDLRVIYSHEQALLQCRENVRQLCPEATLVPMDDTALAARSLAGGAYPENSGVICSRAAGTRFGLHLLKESLQDRPDNATEFVLLRSLASAVTTPPSRLERLVMTVTSQRLVEYAVRGAVVATILGAFLLRDYFGWSSLDAAMGLAGGASAIVLLLTSRRLREWVQLRTLKGYWRYSVEPRLGDAPESQQHKLVRVVQIDGGDRGFRLRGWRQGDGDTVRWEDRRTLVSLPGTRRGNLVYWYANTHGQPNETQLDGVVSLSWTKSHPAQRVDNMSGWYTGFATGDVGIIRYERISASEFDQVRFREPTDNR